MKPYIIDASVAAAAFFQETHSHAAESVLASKHPLQAPDLILAELANVIWNRHGRNEITSDEAEQLMADVLGLPLQLIPMDALVPNALALAIQTHRTVYDCLYLALAMQNDGVMMTADKRLVNGLAQSPLAAHIQWIGQMR